MSNIFISLLFLEKMKKMYDISFHFLKREKNVYNDLRYYIKILRNLKISDNEHEFMLFLRLIL